MAAQPRADEVHQADRHQAAGEGEQLDQEHVQRQEDPEHRAERRAGRNAEDVGRHERIAEHALVCGAGGGERGADDQRRQHARPAHLQHHGLDVRADLLCRDSTENSSLSETG